MPREGLRSEAGSQARPDAPRSPSEEPATGQAPMQPVTINSRSTAAPARGAVEDDARSIQSGGTVSSRVSRASAKVRLAAAQAKARIAMRLEEIERRRLEAEAEVVDRQLEVQILEAEEMEEQSVQRAQEATGRVSDWLQAMPATTARLPEDPLPPLPPARPQPQFDRAGTDTLLGYRAAELTTPAHNNEERAPMPQRRIDNEEPHRQARSPVMRRARFEEDQRERSTTPGDRRGRAIEQLAESIRSMAQQRPPPRQAYELPTFSGDSSEWLAYRAAYRESTRRYDIAPAENMARLRYSLKGRAREHVSSLLYAINSPDSIMRTLEQCYGRPEQIVDRAIDELRALPKLGPTANDLNMFAVKVQNTAYLLTSLDDTGYVRDPRIVKDVAAKLTPVLRRDWCHHAEKLRRVPDITTISEFLMHEADCALKFLSSSEPVNKPANTRSNVRAQPGQYNSARNPKSAQAIVCATSENHEKCLCCGGPKHNVKTCEKFLKLSTNARWRWVKEHRMCFKCLSAKHNKRNCKAPACKADGCKAWHHTLLHSTRSPSESSSEVQQATEVSCDTASVNTTQVDNDNVLLKIMKVYVSGPKKEKQIMALIDEASTQTIIDASLASELGLSGESRPLTIRGVNTQHTDIGSRNVSFSISNISKSETFEIQARTMQDLQLRPQSVSKSEIEKCTHLKHLKIEDLAYERERPLLLLGADNWHLIVTRKLCTADKQSLAASKTRLGWVVHGKKSGPSIYSDKNDICHVYKTYTEDSLEREVKQHYALDSIGISLCEKSKPSDAQAVMTFNKTVKRRDDDRYEVGLPWRNSAVELPPSYSNAMMRLKGIEKKMDKNIDYKEKYSENIQNLIEKRYAEPASLSDLSSPRAWYLPHFAVSNVNKPGKLRLVFDAAARTNDICLNDELLEGPDLLTSLPGILWRFREGATAVAADIQEMFLQVKIIPEDQPAQLFLWRGDRRDVNPNIYKMTSMIFGACSSPFMAHSVRNLNALSHKQEHPDAYEASTRSHYMDDFITSENSSDKLIKISKSVDIVHRAAGFVLRNWHSNSIEVLKQVQKGSVQMTPRPLGASSDCTTTTLGLIWIPDTDELAFNTAMRRVPREVREGQRAPTKREALSSVMSIYDPLGLLSHFTIGAKIILQRLWAKKIGWDEPIPEEEAQDFAHWMSGLERLSELRLPRWYSTGTTYELHVFCDASSQAYAAAAYWRIDTQNDSANVILAAAKPRVAPLKPTTIPRLELQAALLGCRLAGTILEEHRIKPERVIFWCDSKTVIQWIHTDARKHHAFVAHRLGEIAEKTTTNQWRWLPTNENVADEATRINIRRKIHACDRWFQGPDFLKQHENEWPCETQEEPCSEREPAAEHILTTSLPAATNNAILPDITRFSSYNRLIRATAYCFVFINKLRKLEQSELTVQLLRQAELWLIKSEQHQCFAKELLLLKLNKCIPKSSKLYKLDPVLEDGIIRVRGRIDATGAAIDVRRPIILEGSRRFTRLLIEREHAAAGHASNEAVTNEIRQRYWILRLRPTIRAVASACQRCKIHKAKPAVPVMGDLPSVRLTTHLRPFTHCGIDYFGPMEVVIGRRREKRYGALFTCLSTRAVHLEIAHSLTTDSAIMAIRRMAARRGWPAIMLSDRGTNFIGADNQLAAAIREWEPELKKFATTKGMEWRFNPAYAPNMGGAWERLVRSVKRALQSTLHTLAPREEVLHTLMAEAEYMVNNRPLTHVSIDPRDPEALTPNHFLIGSSSNMPLVGDCTEANLHTWRQAQHLANQFWTRWIREYRPQLVQRGEATRATRPLLEGDVVAIIDSTLPRNVWPLGRVERTIKGRDGAIRSAYIKTKAGTFHRPVNKLAVLPIEDTVKELSSSLGGENVAHSSPSPQVS